MHHSTSRPRRRASADARHQMRWRRGRRVGPPGWWEATSRTTPHPNSDVPSQYLVQDAGIDIAQKLHHLGPFGGAVGQLAVLLEEAQQLRSARVRARGATRPRFPAARPWRAPSIGENQQPRCRRPHALPPSTQPRPQAPHAPHTAAGPCDAASSVPHLALHVGHGRVLRADGGGDDAGRVQQHRVDSRRSLRQLAPADMLVAAVKTRQVVDKARRCGGCRAAETAAAVAALTLPLHSSRSRSEPVAPGTNEDAGGRAGGWGSGWQRTVHSPLSATWRPAPAGCARPRRRCRRRLAGP